MTSAIDAPSLADEVNRLEWYHSIDLGNGVVTPGDKTLEDLEGEAAAYFDAVDLAGASFLDIGTWDGANAFEARRRGATRVVAQDWFVWKNYGLKSPFELARRALNMEDIEDLELDVFDFTPDRPGEFDVVLFAGVFYHLYDPIRGLQIVSRCAKAVLILETHCDLLEVERPAMVFYPGKELHGDTTNWWGPNPPCIVDLLKSNGFRRVDFKMHPACEDRGIFHAWRD